MSFSSVGLGSGLDVTSMVSQLVELEKRPLVQLQTQAAKLDARVSAFAQLKSAISNLQDQVAKLTSPETWMAKTASSSKSEYVTASVTSSAMPTTFHVNVQRLAQGQVLASSVVKPSAFSHGEGTLKIQLGKVEGDPSNFVAGASEELSIEFEGKTLRQIASEINEKNAGVSATVLRDSSGERLTFQSTGTGASSAFQISGVGDASAYQFSPSDTGLNPLMAQSQTAQDAKVTVNGVEMYSASNKFSDLSEGVSLTVNKVMGQGETAEIVVKQDSSTGKTALKNLVESFNSFSQSMATMTAYNADTKEAGTLQGDATALSLQNALRRILMSPAGSGEKAFTSLSQVGIEFQKDGKLKIDDTKLDKAMLNSSAMADLWSADPEGVSQDGMAVRLKAFTQGLLSGEGMFATKDEALKSQIKSNTTNQERVTARVNSFEKNLLAKYTALDTKMASLTALDSYISQQVTTWNSSKS